MPEKLWDGMSVDEKLEWLRARIQWLTDAGNTNNTLLDARDNTISDRLSAIQQEMNKILAETQKNKLPSSS